MLDGRPTTPQEVTVSASSEFCGKKDVALVLISQGNIPFSVTLFSLIYTCVHMHTYTSMQLFGYRICLESCLHFLASSNLVIV